MELPEAFKSHRAEAAQLLHQGAVSDVEFSDGTYQVLVGEHWCFLQFDPNGLKDSFCGCDEEDTCEHIAAAYLSLYGEGDRLLNLRFNDGFWGALAHVLIAEFGESGDLDAEGVSLVAIGPAGESLIKTLFTEREEETEETSLKFSNLDEDELEAWRDGEPSDLLRFELSPWTDLCKRLILHENDLKVTLEEIAGEIPSHLMIAGAGLSLGCTISEESLCELIPSLRSVDSNLTSYPGGSPEHFSFEYVRETGSIRVTREVPLGTGGRGNGLKLGRWTYLAGDGFYPDEARGWLAQDEVPVEALPEFLNGYAEVIHGRIGECEVHLDKRSPQVRMQFDGDWNLQLSAYLDEPGDLSGPHSRLMRGWIYQDKEGGHLYRVQQSELPSLEQVIAREDVSDFVSSHRHWLGQQTGFKTHLSQVDTELSWKVDEGRALRFEPVAKETGLIDFGRWVYLPGEGFYARKQGELPSALRAGLVVEHFEVPRFLKHHEDELGQLAGFYLEDSPFNYFALAIELDEYDRVIVEPDFSLTSEYEGCEVEVFYPYAYVQDHGFYELSSSERVPPGYGEIRIIENPHTGSFLNEELPKLRSYAREIDPRLSRPTDLHLEIQGLRQTDAGDFEVHLRYRSNLGTAEIHQLVDSLEVHHRYCFTGAGLLDLEELRFSWIATVGLQQFAEGKQWVTLRTLELMRLNAVEEVHAVDSEQDEDLQRLLSEFTAPGMPSLKGLKSELRPYQEIGVEWLYYLYHYGLSGLLCDDMGLGKTHQAMALIAASRNRKTTTRKKKQRYLVVCPTSVIYHWEDKLAQFLPKIRVRTYYGLQRTLKLEGEPYDLILTSYGVCRRDIKKLMQWDYDVAIFDEIQIAKNHESHIHAALSSIRARTRLGLSGTPIENRLRELKALFDIVLPGYMPSEAIYKETFVVPIEKEDDPARKELLSRYIKPFTLRRKKEEVLDDLPDKTEEIARCELAPDQLALYQTVVREGRDALMGQLESDEAPVPYVHVFALLAKLKQICDHPAVYYKDIANYRDYQSGKWNHFVELIEEARGSEQKVVVFSQYLGMLDIIENYLSESGIQFAGIRGSTVDRGAQMERFQKDPDCEVFVGSLQAAGVGIDLTAASVVIHYDRWWNAARENQATDRVHRIGQHQGVQVFKMVTNGTLEERVHAMIERKGKLMEEVIGTDDQGVLKQLDRRELMQLLSDVSI